MLIRMSVNNHQYKAEGKMPNRVCLKTPEEGMIKFDGKNLGRILWPEKQRRVFQAHGSVNMSKILEEWVVIVHIWEVVSKPMSRVQNV